MDWSWWGAGVMRLPGGAAGAHETALQPMACPGKMSASHWSSSVLYERYVERKAQDTLLKVKTESFPSDDAQARMAPSSCGAHETELTDAVWRVCSRILAQLLVLDGDCCSFQMRTLPSYEQDARMWPNLGCAHATCQTGPVCLSWSQSSRGERVSGRAPSQ